MLKDLVFLNSEFILNFGFIFIVVLIYFYVQNHYNYYHYLLVQILNK